MTSPSTGARIALLADRGVVRVAGEDAEKLLQGMITSDMELLSAQPAIHAALLTPQGKILFDFFVVKIAGGFLLETARRQGRRPRQAPRPCTSCAPRPRSSDRSADYRVSRCGGPRRATSARPPAHVSFPDPRLPALGWRVLADARLVSGIASALSGVEASPEDYHAHRIALGVPEGGKDYAFGDTFPHEADLDQLARRLLHQGLLRRPGGGEPHAEPRQRAQARGAGRRARRR